MVDQSITMHKCAFCNEVYVTEEYSTCDECTERLKTDLIVTDLFQSISTLDKLNLNKLSAQHKRIIWGAWSKLDSIVALLDKWNDEKNQ